MIGVPEIVGAVGALVVGALLGLLTPQLRDKKREMTPAAVPVPVEDEPRQERREGR